MNKVLDWSDEEMKGNHRIKVVHVKERKNGLFFRATMIDVVKYRVYNKETNEHCGDFPTMFQARLERDKLNNSVDKTDK